MMRERIYLDSCVLSRPTDDQTQERIRTEAAAIAHILDVVAEGAIEWVASTVLSFEIRQNSDLQRRADTLELLSLATTNITPAHLAFVRSRHLHSEGYGLMDALLLAIAEEAGVTSLLTVDDRFLKRGRHATRRKSTPGRESCKLVSQEAAMAHQAITQNMTDAEFDQHVIAILARELGPGGFARYLMRHRSGPGDYTAERHQWLDGITIEEIERELLPESGR